MTMEAASSKEELIRALNGRPTLCSFCGADGGEDSVLAVRVDGVEGGDTPEVLCVCDRCGPVLAQVFEIYQEAKREQFEQHILPQIANQLPPHIRELIGLDEKPEQHVSIDGPVI